MDVSDWQTIAFLRVYLGKAGFPFHGEQPSKRGEDVQEIWNPCELQIPLQVEALGTKSSKN